MNDASCAPIAGKSEPIPGRFAQIVARLPFLPDEASWIEALRRPVLMDTTRASEQLGWTPEHDCRSTLRQTIAAHRSEVEAETQRAG